MSTETVNQGPILSDSQTLLDWLAGDGKGELIQLPVNVTRSPLGVGGGQLVGGTLSLKLDDGAMSVSLFERLDQTCGREGPCVVWLEGFWGATVPMPSFGPPDDRHPFSVRRVVGLVEGEPERVRVGGG